MRASPFFCALWFVMTSESEVTVLPHKAFLGSEDFALLQFYVSVNGQRDGNDVRHVRVVCLHQRSNILLFHNFHKLRVRNYELRITSQLSYHSQCRCPSRLSLHDDRSGHRPHCQQQIAHCQQHLCHQPRHWRMPGSREQQQ